MPPRRLILPCLYTPRHAQELLAQAQAGTLAAGQEAGAALAAAAADVDKWRQEIAQEKGSLHRHWDR